MLPIRKRDLKKGQISIEIIVMLSILILGTVILAIFVFGIFNRNIDYSHEVDHSKDQAFDSVVTDLVDTEYNDIGNVINPVDLSQLFGLTLIANPLDSAILYTSGNYPLGVVVISADPFDGYNFLNWTNEEGDIVCDTIICYYNLYEDKTLYANFESTSPTNYNLTLLKNPVSAQANLIGSGTYLSGDLISLDVEITGPYDFINWTDNNGNIISTLSSFNYVMPSQDTTLIANLDFNLLDFEHCLFSSSKCEESFVIDGCGEDTVLDYATGFCWMRNLNPISESNWINAKNYCNTLTLAGHDDWRLPPRHAILSLFDLTRTPPYVIGGTDNIFFNGNGAYWSDSVVYNLSSHAWSVNIYNGGSEMSPKTNTFRVLCYRRM